MPETRATEDLTPTPTQAENDAAMLAAYGQPPGGATATKAEAEEVKPAATRPAAHPEQRR